VYPCHIQDHKVASDCSGCIQFDTEHTAPMHFALLMYSASTVPGDFKTNLPFEENLALAFPKVQFCSEIERNASTIMYNLVILGLWTPKF